MDWYTGPEGDQRIWYEASEIEDAMAEQLRRGRQVLTLASPSPDLEAFVEQHLRVDLDQYATLPEGVLGMTEFGGSRQPKMYINSTLTEAADQVPPRSGARGRWRATIAHEAAHVILHRYLYDPAMPSIRSGDFRDPPEQPRVSGQLLRVECLNRSIENGAATGSRTARDWREVQANRGMAALLMPGSIFRRVATMKGAVNMSGLDASNPDGLNLVSEIATVFDVSRQAATYRLQAFGFLA
jgi:hypothetical protein